MLEALRFGSFRWLFGAQVASSFGNFAFVVAIAALLVEDGAGAGTIGTVSRSRRLESSSSRFRPALRPTVSLAAT